MFLLDLPELVNENCLPESDSSDEENWIETEENEETRCLFCHEMFSAIEKAINHLNAAHHFNLRNLKEQHSMDFYSYIKVLPLVVPYANHNLF